VVGHGYFKFGLGYSLGCLHLLPVDGGLGPQWSLGYNHGPSLCLITMESTLQVQAFSVLAVLALALMVIVTGGVIYLTAADWRDRRRRQRDRETNKPQRSKTAK
jgi:hypothetical protein